MASVSRRIAREWLLPTREMRRVLWPPLIGLAYIASTAMFGGPRADQVMIGSLGFLDLYNTKTRLFLRTFLPFIATGLIFDSLRHFYWAVIAGRVHVAGPYLLDRAWFGVGGGTLNEYFLVHHWAIADFATGFAYLTFVAEYLGMALFLFFCGAVQRTVTFARCFLVVNVMGFITYLVYPAAPPWYVAAHGFGTAEAGTMPSPAGAERFDALFGTHFFDRMYGHSIDVYGAIPSLHVAYPLLAFLLALRTHELRWVRVPAGAFSLLMCFSAVYLQHHYVIDVLFGTTYAVITLLLVSAWERRRVVQTP